MPVYPCPECGVQLRPANPVPAGQKLRCPKCETISRRPKRKTPAKAGPSGQPAAEQIEQDGLVVAEVSEDAEANRTAFDPIKERFKRSARGPALILVVKPSTALLGGGLATLAMAIAGALFAVWPMIFKIEETKPLDKMARFRPPTDSTRRFKELKPEEYRDAVDPPGRVRFSVWLGLLSAPVPRRCTRWRPIRWR